MKRLLIGMIALTVPAMAQAQSQPGFYAGAGLSYTDAESTAFVVFSERSTGNLAGVSVVGGYVWDQGTWKIGAELDADISIDGAMDSAFCGTAATGEYMCDQTATVRLRGIVATQVGAGTLFGALGVGAVFGDFATNTATVASSSVSGLSVGAGFIRPFGNNFSLRGELNYDLFDQSNQPFGLSSEWKAISARVMAVRSF